MMDQLVAMKPDSVDDIIRVLFLRKLPAFIRDVINPNDHKNIQELTQRCNEVWENKADATEMSSAAVAAAAHRPTSPARASRPSSSPFRGRRPTYACSH